MSAIVLDGKMIGTEIRQKVKLEVQELREKYAIVPGLAVIIVGEDPASKIYVRNKQKACEEIGIHSEMITLPEQTEQTQLLEIIEKLNNDTRINGILVQLPLPQHINSKTILEAITPDKDVDGFHPVNAGKLFIGQEGLVPCTPYGIIKMLEMREIPIAGKHAVIIGRSNIVGKPMAMLLLARNATVTICHSKTQNLAAITRTADILVAAIGKANFVSRDMVKKGAVVIDVGINRLPSKKLAGDVDYEQVKEVASYITPVPGGVGPLTITMLLHNTVQATKIQHARSVGYRSLNIGATANMAIN